MSLRWQSHYPLQALNSFGFAAEAERYTELRDLDDVAALRLWLQAHPQPMLLLGGGSNLVLADKVPGVVARVALPGLEIQEQGDTTLVTLGAGEEWHASVARLMALGIYGLENLALIPGCVGAVPVQNVGAYGVEVKDRIDAVQVFEWDSARTLWLSNEQCRFGYRDSLFKRTPERYLITAVRFRLSRVAEPVLEYAALRAQFDDDEEVGPQQIFDAVCRIRRSKLPDPARLGNAGSFFKNPLVSEAQYQRLRHSWPDLVSYPDAAGRKLAAGWLIDRCGWKGRRWRQVGVHEQQALVLVNLGAGDRAQLEELAEQIRADVQQRFGVMLEIEPRFYP